MFLQEITDSNSYASTSSSERTYINSSPTSRSETITNVPDATTTHYSPFSPVEETSSAGGGATQAVTNRTDGMVVMTTTSEQDISSQQPTTNFTSTEHQIHNS